jgi:hypothetical protein
MQFRPYCITYNIENSFSLFIQQNTTSARIKMILLKDPVNTADIPYAFDILKNFLPSVLTTECFNDERLPFSQEVRRTEIGHLFEHILLEYMCQLKIAKGHKSAVYAGRTSWNWERDPRGIFHIHINCKLKDADILPFALNKSIALMKIILQNNFSYNSKPSADLYLGLKNGKKLKRT